MIVRLSRLLAVCLLLPAMSSAQGLTPPSLIEEAEPTLRVEQEAAVVLRITIGVDGAVTEAEVVEGATPSLDQAAVDALRRSRFRPATQAGTPVPVRVLYRLVFRPDVSTQEEPPDTELQDTGPQDTEPQDAPQDAPQDTEPQDTPQDAPQDTEPQDTPTFGAEAEVERDWEGLLERSAEAVNVINTRELQHRAVDLGDVLAREQGVAIRRNGGLGSTSRFSLAGLYDDQIRFFVDGVPLNVAGFPFGLANVPISLVDSVEIHRGVVPIRLGADALGGAVNLNASQRLRQTYGAASYQFGSFGTHRASLAARYHDADSGFVVGGLAFADHSDNDYDVDVEIPDERGRLQPARVRRFHDAYTAFGGTFDIGVLDRPWARRLTLRLFGTGYDKELQHNVVMTVPYGEVTFFERAYGATLRYDHQIDDVRVDLVTSVATLRTDFQDLGERIFDWRGNVLGDRAVPGEIQSVPQDQTFRQWTSFSRAGVFWDVVNGHTLGVTATPEYTTRSGNDRRTDDEPDPLSGEQDLFKLTIGAAHEMSIVNDRIENVLFAKYYYYRADTEQLLPGRVFRSLDERSHTPGVGNATRFLLHDSFWIKASYEWATRLPNSPEVFGDGRLVLANLELQPERSHNLNLSAQLDHNHEGTGRWAAEVNLFARLSDDLIVLLGNERSFIHQNVFRARGLGVEASAQWTSPESHVSLGGNVTYQDVRNVSSQGAFGDFDGDRIPNRPYFFANANAALRAPNLVVDGDSLTFSWDFRFVHEFFRGWESQGLRAFKQTVDTQRIFGLALSYATPDPTPLTFTLDLQNVTDARVFDLFGVQRPGRTVFFKVRGEI